MKTNEKVLKVMKIVDQIVDLTKDLSTLERLTVFSKVCNDLNQPEIPAIVLGNMAKMFGSNHAIISIDEKGVGCTFFNGEIEINVDGKPVESKTFFANDADEYKEDETPADGDEPNLEEIEKESIRRALEKHEWNSKIAAKELQISPRTLYRKMEKYGLKEKAE